MPERGHVKGSQRRQPRGWFRPDRRPRHTHRL